MSISAKLKAGVVTFVALSFTVVIAYTNCGRAVLGDLNSASSGNNTQSVNVGASSCPTGQVAIGLTTSQSVVCAPLVTSIGNTCPTGSSLYLTSTNTVTCVTNTSWDQPAGTSVCAPVGSYLISYSTAGGLQCGMPTGTLTGLIAQCSAGFYLNGVNNGNAVCLPLPTSTPSALVCPTYNYLRGVNGSTAVCELRPWAASTATASCPAGQFAIGWANNTLVCRQSSFNAPTTSTACAPGLVLQSISGGAAACVVAPNPDLSSACRAGYSVSGVAAGVVLCSPNENGSTHCGPGQFVTGLNNGMPVCTTVAVGALPGACPQATYPIGVSSGVVVCAGFDNNRYPASASLCFPGDNVLCSVMGGMGHQTCNGSGTGYSSCTVDTCSQGYQLVGGVCQTLSCNPGTTQTCSVSHGAGQQICGIQGTWGSCQPVSCDAGYFANNGTCIPIVCTPGGSVSCTSGAGTGTKTCSNDGSGYGACVITTCQNGYTLTNGACVDTSPPRITFTAPTNPSYGNTLTIVYAVIDNETGVKGISCSLDNVALASCTSPLQLTGLTDGTHTFKVTAIDNTNNSASATTTWTSKVCSPNASQSCTIAHGAGSQTCQADGTFTGTCVPVSCEAGYHSVNNACVSLNCGAGYSAVGNACVDNLNPTLTITARPADPTINANSVTQFTATDAGSGIALTTCQLDATVSGACSSPVTFSGLSSGAHHLVITAKDQAGNVATAAVDWKTYSCAPGSQKACTVSYGSGVQTCSADGSTYGGCTATACQSGYTVDGGTCVRVPVCSDVQTHVGMGFGSSPRVFGAYACHMSCIGTFGGNSLCAGGCFSGARDWYYCGDCITTTTVCQ